MRGALILALCLGLAAPAAAQDRTRTLADIRQELSVLLVALQRLRGELNTTGGVQAGGASGSLLARVDAIESELRRLTGLTEALELRIDRVVDDGTNRIGDLEFRLCELDTACDIAALAETPSLGGVEALPGDAPPPVADAPSPPGANLALAEQDDFDRARAAFDNGDFAAASELFAAFTATYPGGPLSAESHFLRGQAEERQGAWDPAARAYLDAFTADPGSARAPEALLNLGTSLGRLGKTEEACLTLAEVGTRYPASPSAPLAEAARLRLACS